MYRYLQILQLSHYHKEQYLKYVYKNYLNNNLIFIFLLLALTLFNNTIMLILCLLVAFIVGVFQFLPSKKRLYATPRIIRLIIISMLISLIICLLPHTIFKYLAVLSLEFVILAAKYLLLPIEKKINKTYQNQMLGKLTRFNGKKIGITGSYGKTSMKNILNKLLGEKFNTITTPKSYNTPLGIMRFINDNNLDYIDYMILEFGASKKGDIKELVEYYSPDIAMITAIGYMHLDTFKSIENIVEEKMSLLESIPEDNFIVLNYDNEYIRSYPLKENAKVLTYGLEYGDYQAKDIVLGTDQSSFSLFFKDELLSNFKTKLIGRHQILNITGALALAYNLGVDLTQLEKAVANLDQIENRLSIRKYENMLIIDDSFNSNLEGAINAIEILKNSTGERVIITPGFVENEEVLKDISIRFADSLEGSCDYILFVGMSQTIHIQKRLNELDIKYYLFDSFKDAYNFFTKIEGFKTLLIENDLPDQYDGGRK